MKMSNKIYDILKWIALIVLPAIATLYAGIAATWGLPYGDAISATIGFISVFLGTVLQISNSNYKKTA